MSTTIELRFPAGRFHATPWGRNVNEAAPEWPPSPWRLLRALVWVWKHKAPDLLSTSEAEDLFQALAATVPTFRLPRATQGHTRHWMPLFKKRPEDKVLVFDAFVAIGPKEPVALTWPMDLSQQQRVHLSTLLSLLGHLGRAESWCVATLAQTDSNPPPTETNCFPVENNPKGNHPTEIVSVLCPDGANAFASQHIPTPKPSKKNQPAPPPTCDPAWHLCLETQDLQKMGWSDPPGSRWVSFRRNPDAFLPKPAPTRKPAPETTFHTATFLLDSIVRPRIQDSLSIAELARRFLMGIYRRLEEENSDMAQHSSLPGQCTSSNFSGKSADGVPLIGHNHAHFLPLDRDGDGRVDQLVVYSPKGFCPTEAKALRILTHIPLDDDYPVRLALLGFKKTGPWDPSTTWISSTPYLATRFPKKNGSKRDPVEFFGPGGALLFLQADLLQQIQRAGLPPPIAVEPLLDSQGVFRSTTDSGRLGLRPIQFRTQRRKETRSVRRHAGFFRIVWDLPVNGPICLGHNSHFGLGLFQPIG